MPVYMKIDGVDGTLSREPSAPSISEIVVTKPTDCASLGTNIYGDAFAFGDTSAKGGTAIASVTDMVIDPFDPSAALGDGSVRFLHDPVVVAYEGGVLPINVAVADLDGFKPLFAFTTPDL